MKILFVGSQLYLPQLYGGVQTSTDELCHALIARGHEVALLMKVMSGGWFGNKARFALRLNKFFLGSSVAKDTDYGYPVWRAWFPADVANYVCQQECPDLIVILSGGAILPVAFKLQQTGIPLLVQLHDVAFHEYGKEFTKLSALPCVANSHFCAEQYRQRYGIVAPVVYPFVSADRYITTPRRLNVTFINPVQRKGLDLALQIARLCPEIPFSFVEGWTLSQDQRQALEQGMAGLANIRLVPSQRDMRPVYEACKILLVPSLFEETFGRVTAEAQANGIPVLAMRRGGLPESVGPGGILFDPEVSAEDWAHALRTLWQDNASYADLSAKALHHARRRELDPTHQATLWEKIFQEAILA